MGKSQRTKGAAGERELARFISETIGVKAARSARNGVDAAEDIAHGITGLHIECKRVEALNVPAALAKAAQDAGGKIPTLWHRRNRGEWLLTIRAADLLILADLIQAHKESTR